MAEERARPRPTPWLWAVALTGFALLLIPLLTLTLAAFFPLLQGSGRRSFSFAAFAQLFSDPDLGAALQVSVQVAAAASLGSTLLGTCGALAIERGRFPGRELLAWLTMVPLVLPELVLGLSSVIWFSVLHLTLGRASIILAHITFTASYVVITVRARFSTIEADLAEAAQDLGASPAQTFRLVTLPLLAPGVIAGAMMAFTLSFDDFLISFFTAGVGSDTLPMKLYAMIRFGMKGEIYALSALLMGLALAVLGLQVLWRRVYVTLQP